MVMRMRGYRIVEACNVRDHTKFELIKGMETMMIQFLLFQVLEKALHNSIIIRMIFSRVGLNHIWSVNFLAEISAGKL